jgi:branched-chain amino acid aminotransferase
MPITPTDKIWMNGELVDWDKAQVHVLTHGLHYGSGVFEGIRAYETADGPAIFRLTEHIERLFNSAKILGMVIPYTVQELIDATKQTVAATGLSSCYIRPLAYLGYGEMGLNTLPCTTDVAIACWPWGAYLGDDAVSKGVRLKTSSWTRHDHNTMPPAAKTTGNYVNSSLAKVEAIKAGYDEAVMLAPNGLVDLGFDARLDDLARTDLYIAEEAFVCGTAAEVSSVNSVDDREIPCPGPMTLAIAEKYHQVIRGKVDKYRHWCELAV